MIDLNLLFAYGLTKEVKGEVKVFFKYYILILPQYYLLSKGFSFYPLDCFWCLYLKSIDFIYVGLILYSFCSIDFFLGGEDMLS